MIDIYCTVLDEWSKIKISFEDQIPRIVLGLGFGVSSDKNAFVFSTHSHKKETVTIFGTD